MKRRQVSKREYEAQRLVNQLLHPELAGTTMEWINLERLVPPTYQTGVPLRQINEQRQRLINGYKQARKLNHILPDRVRTIVNMVNEGEYVSIFPNVKASFNVYMNLENIVDDLETNPLEDEFGINELDRLRKKITWFENIYRMTGTLPRKYIPHIPEGHRYVESKYIRDHVNVIDHFARGVTDERGMQIVVEDLDPDTMREPGNRTFIHVNNPFGVFPIIPVDTIMKKKILNWFHENPNATVVSAHLTKLPQAFLHTQFNAFNLKYLATKEEIIILSFELVDLTDLGRCIYRDKPFGQWVITEYKKAYFMHIPENIYRKIKVKGVDYWENFNNYKVDISLTTTPEDYEKYDDKISKNKKLREIDMMVVGKYLTLNEHAIIPRICREYRWVPEQYRVTPFGLESGKEFKLFEKAEEVRVYDDNPNYELLPKEHARIMVRFLLYMDAVCKELSYEETYSDTVIVVTRTSTPEDSDAMSEDLI